MSTHTPQNVFRSRNFRLVFFGALVSELGAVMYSFAVGFYILQISGNNAVLQGLYLAACGAATLLATPLGGVLGDRCRKSAIMSACDYIKGGIILLAGLLLLLFRAPDAQILVLFVSGVCGGVISGIFSPASRALLPHIVEEERLQQANAYFTIKSSLESILGIVLAGVLYAALPIHLLLVLVGLCYILSCVSEMFIRYAHTAPKERLTLRLAWRDLRAGVDYLKGRKAILALMASTLFINFFFLPVGSNFIPYFVRTDIANAPRYLLDHWLTPELWSSVFTMLIGVSSLIGAAVLSARRQREKCGRMISLLLLVIAVIMIGLTFSYWLLIGREASLNVFLVLFSVGCFAIGFLLTWINIPLSTTLMRIVDRAQLSKVSSITAMASQGLTPIAAMLAGFALQYLGSTGMLAICTAGLTVTAVCMFFNRHIREI